MSRGARAWARAGSCAAGLVLSVAFAMVAPGEARAASRAECRSMHSAILGHAVAYCVLLPPSYDADASRHYPVLYLLHGIGENEQFLVRSGGLNLVEDLWEQQRIGEYLIATPAADSSFYINSHDGRVRYEDFFLREFMPGIERAYRTKAGRASRGISGVSMGGYGALHLAFRHPELFAAVSAHSAALIEKLPDVTGAGAAGNLRLRILGNVFGSPPDRAFWERNNPLALARTANLTGLKIYFDCGSEDDYGFYAGAGELDRILTSRGIAHEFHLDPGGHDWEYFAEHLPASLEFQSKALGAQGKHATGAN
jgi:S-formylglutathione hydrolase FrmB